jgi:transposase
MLDGPLPMMDFNLQHVRVVPKGKLGHSVRRTPGARPRSPPKANRKTPRTCDFALYCERNLVERFFNKLKHFRAIATRYDKLARNFLAGVQLACAIILLN